MNKNNSIERIKVLHAVSRMDRAGQETFIMNLFRKINRDEIMFDFMVSLPGKGDYDDEIHELGGKILNELSFCKQNPIPIVKNILQWLRLFKFFRKHQDYKIVHFHNYHAFSVLAQITAAKAARVKSVIVHSHNTNSINPRLHKLVRPILKLFNITKLACSEDAAKWMFGEDVSNVMVVKNGIDSKSFLFNAIKRSETRANLGIADNEWMILHIGRFNFQKNHNFLIEVFSEIHKRYPKALLALVGSGELEPQINIKIKSLDLEDSVMRLGIRNDVPALMSASDLFLFPSLFEGLSVVLVEAQANGIPILSNENLAKETFYTPVLHTLSLNEGVEIWASKAIDLLKTSHHTDTSSYIKQSGFDMTEVSKDMESLYKSL